MGILELSIVLLQMIFIVLKLCNVIYWSWIVVLIPLWILLGIIILAIIINIIKTVKDIRRL